MAGVSHHGDAPGGVLLQHPRDLGQHLLGIGVNRRLPGIEIDAVDRYAPALLDLFRPTVAGGFHRPLKGFRSDCPHKIGAESGTG
jgi:hypothetical protein